ncbi:MULTISPECIES: hypothetical protein [unclassified Rhizobium]|nr:MULTISPECIES: hypothetical protein [unclassified Rhizobium]MBX5166789.1 hypothetical protein [Rhizobium sp. NZLR4b]MBX5186327.1 hypothetical protein [Rhizobium sp. NZLR5]
MKKRLVKNFVVEIRKRRGRKLMARDGNPITRAIEKMKAQVSLQPSR